MGGDLQGEATGAAPLQQRAEVRDVSKPPPRPAPEGGHPSAPPPTSPSAGAGPQGRWLSISNPSWANPPVFYPAIVTNVSLVVAVLFANLTNELGSSDNKLI